MPPIHIKYCLLQYLPVASLGWVTPGRQLRVSPLYFFLKTWRPFLVVSSAVSPLISSSLYRFLLLSLWCHPPRGCHVPHTFFYLSDLVSPLFFVNLPTIFFPSGVTPWRVSPGAVRPPSDATGIYTDLMLKQLP